VEVLRELPKQIDVPPVKNRSIAGTDAGKLIQRPFVDPSDRHCRLQEEVMEMTRKWRGEPQTVELLRKSSQKFDCQDYPVHPVSRERWAITRMPQIFGGFASFR
jgi:hypothetical protein